MDYISIDKMYLRRKTNKNYELDLTFKLNDREQLKETIFLSHENFEKLKKVKGELEIESADNMEESLVKFLECYDFEK